MSSSTLLRYKDIIRKFDCSLLGTEWKRLSKRGDYVKSCFDNVISDYEDYLVRTGKTKNYVSTLVRRVSEFLALIEQLGCTQIKHISAEMILKGFNEATSKVSFRGTIGIFLEYAYNREMTKSNLRYLIPSVVRSHNVPSIYSPEEVERLLDCIDRSIELGKRNYAVILIAARLGLRASDIANLQFDNLKAGKVEIIQFKTKQPLTLTLPEEVQEAIRDYVDHGRPSSSSSYVFLNNHGRGAMTSNNIVTTTRIVFKQSGIDSAKRKIGPHSLRASLATALLSEGNDYYTIQKVLGHLNVQSTKFYAKADIEQLRVHAMPTPMPSDNFAKLLAGEMRIQ